MTDPREFLEEFARTHVVPAFRRRFVHEALKKPGKLQWRICHKIHQVFPDDYRGGHPPFSSEDICIPITGSGIVALAEYPWSHVEKSALRGIGLLVVSPDGKEFYAETEADYGNPSVGYSS